MKKLLGIGLTLAMLFSGACGNTELSDVSTESNAQGTSDSVGEDRSQSSDMWEDMAEIEVMYASMGPVPAGLQAVEDAINAVTEPEINTCVHLNPIEMGNYVQQTSLMISSNQQVDLMMFPYGAASFPVMQAQGQWMDITDLLSEYAAPTLDLLGDLVSGTSVNGRIYGVCGYRNMAGSEYIIMRTDVLEDLNLLDKAENMKNFEEFEEILYAVENSEKWSSLVPLASGGNGGMIFCTNLFDPQSDFNTSAAYDSLGSIDELISAKMQGDELVMGLTYEMPEYKAIYEKTNDWYEKGYIYQDAATTQDMGAQLVQSGVVFSYISNGEYGAEATHSQNCGMPMTCVKVQDFPITTSQTQQFGWGVPTTSVYPEAAVAFLNLMFTDERIANLLAWGIEDVDYEVVDNVASYIEGNENPQYHTVDFYYGNQFITLPWEGTGSEFRTQSLAEMEKAQISPFMGFACDTSSVTDELAAVTNCLNEYRKIINTGVASPEQYEEFINKLHSVGADKIVECYKNQLEEWLETNQ